MVFLQCFRVVLLKHLCCWISWRNICVVGVCGETFVLLEFFFKRC